MIADKKECTISVITRILEESAYVFTDVLEDPPAQITADWKATGVKLKFFGKESGEMRMWASDGFAQVVAANMLGIGEEDEQAIQKGMDALKESLNIILGNFITTVYGVELIFDLGLPEAVDPCMLTADMANPEAIWLSAEGYPVLFVTEMANGQP